MDFLLFVIIFFLTIRVANAMMQKAVSKAAMSQLKKNCPPHEWQYETVRDQEGNIYEGLVCRVCRRLPNYQGRE